MKHIKGTVHLIYEHFKSKLNKETQMVISHMKNTMASEWKTVLIEVQ